MARISDLPHSEQVERVEINVTYVIALALSMLINDIEKSLLSRRVRYKQDRKRRVNNIISSIKEIKRNLDIIDYIDFAEDLEGHYDAYQYYQEDAAELARLVLLFADRQGHNPDNANEVFRLLRSQKGEGIIDEETLKRFYLKK